MSYQIVASCVYHQGEIVNKATSKKAALALRDTMAKTVLKDLDIPRSGRASIFVLHKKNIIERTSVSYGDNGKPFIETRAMNLGAKTAAK